MDFVILVSYLLSYFQTPSNKKIDITTVSSNYHLEVNPSDVGFHDRVVIQELIKTVAQTHQLDPSGQREFKGRKATFFKYRVQIAYMHAVDNL